MARQFGGDAAAIRESSERRVSRALGFSTARWDPLEKAAFSDFALILDLIPGLSRWTRSEKDAIAGIVRAKAGPLESRYLRLLQRHPRLHAALIRLGSTVVP